MRSALLLVLALPCLASADRVFTVPVGRKLPFRTVRAEYMFVPSDTGRSELWLGAGVGPAWEVEARFGRFGRDNNRVGTADISYNLAAPIVDLSPGISIGVRDAANTTDMGLQGFAAVTMRQLAELDAGDSYLDVTLGIAVGKRFTSLMFGASVPLSTKVRILGDHDGRRLSLGAEWRVVPTLALRAYVADSRPVLSVASYFKF